MIGQLAHRAVHQVAGHGHRIGLQLVHAVHDAVQVGLLDRRADVDIADLGDGEAVQRLGQVGNRHIHLDHPGQPARIEIADHADEQRQSQHGHRAVGQQGGWMPAHGQRAQQEQVARHGQDQQR
ncbi:hypothetical protein D3C86_1820510 [compost metagenome]